MGQRALWTAAAWVVLLGAVCGCEGDPQKPEYWVKALEDRKTRETAIKDIRKDKAEVHIDGLLALSKKDDDPNRADVAQILGQLGEKFPARVNDIGPALKDMVDFGVGGASDKASRLKNLTNKNVADAFARMRFAGGAETMSRLLDSKDQNTRLAAVAALGEIGAKDSSDKLIALVNEDDNNFMVKNAIKALGNIADPKAVPSLVRMMFFERSVSFYAEASFALFQIGKPAVPALVDTLNGK